MQTDERKNGGKGTCFEETVPAVRKQGWGSAYLGKRCLIYPALPVIDFQQ